MTPTPNINIRKKEFSNKEEMTVINTNSKFCLILSLFLWLLRYVLDESHRLIQKTENKNTNTGTGEMVQC